MKIKGKNGGLLILYLVVIIIFCFVILYFPKMLQNNQLQYLESIEDEIQYIVKETDYSNLSTELQNLRTDYPLEISIYHEKAAETYELVYQSLPGVDFVDLKNILAKNSVLTEWQGKLQGKNGVYVVWYSIYPPKLTSIIDFMFIIQTFLIGLTTLLLFTVFIVMQRQLMNPLAQIKQRVDNLNRFELEEVIGQTDDVINQDMISFAKTLDEKIKNFSKSYTQLEYELELEKQRLRNIIDISKGLVHDLKTPLHQVILENDLILNEPNLSRELQIVTNYNIKKIDEIMHQINDILKMLNPNLLPELEEKEVFDVVKMYEMITSSFITLLNEKQLLLFADLDEELEIKANRLSTYLIIHNILSNAIKYAPSETDINIEMYVEANELYISCTNDANKQDIERMKLSENIFLANEFETQVTDENNKYSSGTGLYLIRELTASLHGEYRLEIIEMQTVHAKINVKIPLSEGMDIDES